MKVDAAKLEYTYHNIATKCLTNTAFVPGIEVRVNNKIKEPIGETNWKDTIWLDVPSECDDKDQIHIAFLLQLGSYVTNPYPDGGHDEWDYMGLVIDSWNAALDLNHCIGDDFEPLVDPDKIYAARYAKLTGMAKQILKKNNMIMNEILKDDLLRGYDGSN